MAQQRRPIVVKQSSSGGAGGSYGGSIWEKEASEYWKQMHVDEQRSNKRMLVVVAGAGLLALAGLVVYATSAPSSTLPPLTRTELVRANCTAVAVKSKWHTEMCEKVCPTNEFSEACTSGCLYGSLAVTKSVCANRSLDMPFSSTCEFSVDCVGPCKEYAIVRPIPAKRNACEGGCNSVVPSACKRAVDLFDRAAKDRE
ncbi:Aste57867_465 [Aphanomyces stellatus]|uniref:Aste57867_465 protein n=1 Tax=Aphanomyces stellatus TaxID=120398 RepID=A0A485K2V4_9STRA|nr:hypothetical protein As57867_000464 [Aphanomyces stellatus]VFT77690.1 Aste57867_465 [Aphanomyces stellatus]